MKTMFYNHVKNDLSSRFAETTWQKWEQNGKYESKTINIPFIQFIQNHK